MEKKKEEKAIVTTNSAKVTPTAPNPQITKPAAMPTLKCVRNTRGIYRLYRQMPDGRMRYVPRVGRSAQPFEVIAQFPNQPIVAIKRYVKTGNTVTPRLYLLDLNTGRIPAMSRGGVPFIYYNKSRNKFVADPTSAAAADAHDLAPEDTTPNMTAELYMKYLQQLQMILATALGKKLDIVARPPRRHRITKPRARIKMTLPYNTNKKPNLKYRVVQTRTRRPVLKLTHMYPQSVYQHVR